MDPEVVSTIEAEEYHQQQPNCITGSYGDISDSQILLAISENNANNNTNTYGDIIDTEDIGDITKDTVDIADIIKDRMNIDGVIKDTVDIDDVIKDTVVIDDIIKDTVDIDDGIIIKDTVGIDERFLDATPLISSQLLTPPIDEDGNLSSTNMMVLKMIEHDGTKNVSLVPDTLVDADENSTAVLHSGGCEYSSEKAASSPSHTVPPIIVGKNAGGFCIQSTANNSHPAIPTVESSFLITGEEEGLEVVGEETEEEIEDDKEDSAKGKSNIATTPIARRRYPSRRRTKLKTPKNPTGTKRKAKSVRDSSEQEKSELAQLQSEVVLLVNAMKILEQTVASQAKQIDELSESADTKVAESVRVTDQKLERLENRITGFYSDQEQNVILKDNNFKKI